MELIKFDLKEKYEIGKVAAALGEFDGLHLAHQKLILEAVNYAKNKNIKSAVISFDPHPDFVLGKREDTGYITPLSDKVRELEKLGVDYFIVIPFTLSLAKLKPQEFISAYLNKFKIEELVVGFDYRFGHRGSGDIKLLKEHFNLKVIDKITLDNQKVGSNEIREYLLEGDMDLVKHMLGRYYTVSGIVKTGNQVGRTLGIRTANITIEKDYQTLRHGVYATFIYFKNKKYFGVCNVGHNPTVNYIKIARIEVHIFDFEQEIYGEEIKIEFVKFLRPEIKFATVEKMISAINEDIKTAKRLLKATL